MGAGARRRLGSRGAHVLLVASAGAIGDVLPSLLIALPSRASASASTARVLAGSDGAASAVFTAAFASSKLSASSALPTPNQASAVALSHAFTTCFSL